MKKVFIFTVYVTVAVFGFIVMNFKLLHYFQSAFSLSEDMSKGILVWGWGLVLLANLFYFGIVKEGKLSEEDEN